MDTNKQIRFLYPPFFLLTSLFIGLWLDPLKSPIDYLPDYLMKGGAIELKSIIGLAGGGVIILAFGYLIGTISVFILTILFSLFGKNYEACPSRQALYSIKRHFKISKDIKVKDLNLSASFDHGMLSPKIHDWSQRRWISFTTS